MSKILNDLFDKLGYNRENGLYVLSELKENDFNNFPHRIGRVLKEIVKPFAVFNLESNKDSEHIKPFNIPLIIFYDNPSIKDYEKIARDTFNLSQAPIVFISNDLKGTAEIYHGYNFSNKNSEWLSKIDLKHDIFYVSRLRNGDAWEDVYNKYFKTSKTVDKYLLSNITDCRRILISKNQFSRESLLPEIANKLIGRVIFIRYLIDRNVEFNDQKILTGENKSERQKSFTELLQDKESTYKFFKYIADKFKGDLFPLEFYHDNKNVKEFDFVNSEHLMVLYHLLSCSEFFLTETKINSTYSIQKSLFQYYDFEIIPVELISNIYESFLGSSLYAKDENEITELSKQKQVQAYYTPPFLVDYVLSQTVKKHLDNQNTSSCRVLDPSCGSGIFLVETLRLIIEKELKLSNFQPLDNEKLWNLVQENIFGIDIDSNAIEISTFSLYITLLDYKKYPKEIEEFKFKPLKNTNLFSGVDFFDLNHEYNDIFKTKVSIDFIVGNPPWGKVKESSYRDYIKRRKLSENSSCSIEIGGEEISQAFLLRASDLVQKDGNTKFCFIVTGKNFYNSNSLQWRKYFLSTYKVIQFFDLFGVQNKIAGGNQIFENAKQPAAICLYQLKGDADEKNQIQHVVARANKFFNYFKTILIEKNDVKLVSQEMFLKYDWLWKTLLYGNSLDFFLIKRLLNDFSTSIVGKNKFEINELEFEYHGGYKAKDGVGENKNDTTTYFDYDYLEVDARKDLVPFSAHSSIKFINKLKDDLQKKRIKEDFKVAQIPNKKFLDGKKLLIKKGIEIDKNTCSYKAVSAFTEKRFIFSSTIASVIPRNINNSEISKEEDFLYLLSAIINSNLFIYFSLMKSSSFGADRNRINFEEFFEMPIAFDMNLLELAKDLNKPLEFFEKKNIHLLDDYISKAYKITKQEQAVIDYAIEVSVPIMRRVGRTSRNPRKYIFNSITFNNEHFIKDYAEIFHEHFSVRFNSQNLFFNVDAYIDRDFIALHFIVSEQRDNWFLSIYDSSLTQTIKNIGNLAFNEVTKDLFYQQDVRGFNRSSFYIIKPNEVKNWHRALAYLDLNDFIDALAKAEFKSLNL